MKMNQDFSSSDIQQHRYIMTPNRYWVLTIILSAITASSLSHLGFLIFDPISSFFIGIGLGIIYAIAGDRYWAHVRAHVTMNKIFIQEHQKEKEEGE